MSKFTIVCLQILESSGKFSMSIILPSIAYLKPPNIENYPKETIWVMYCRLEKEEWVQTKYNSLTIIKRRRVRRNACEAEPCRHSPPPKDCA